MSTTKHFKYPKEYETMTVEEAINFLELAVIHHHMYIFNDKYDFAYQLVKKCNINTNYVLNNLDKIIDSIHNYQQTEKIIIELKNNIVDKSTINLELFKQELELLKETQTKEIERKKGIKEAKQRYKELNFLKRILINLKKEKPTQELFNSKTTNQINKMYKQKKRI